MAAVTRSAAAADKDAKEKASFEALREDYREATRTSLVALDRRVAELESAAARASGRDRDLREEQLRVIRERREAFVRDSDALSKESAGTWDAMRVRVDRQLAELVSRAAGV